MFHRELTYGNNRLVIHLTIDPMHSAGDSHFFGFPQYEYLMAVDNDSIAEVVNDIKGYFLYVGIESDGITVVNDITGGFRVYLGHTGDTTFLSDNSAFVLEKLQDDSPLENHEEEFRFWDRHGYTTGEATFVRRCEKLPPAGVLKIDRTGVRIDSYFKDLSSDCDAISHSRLFSEDLADTLSGLKHVSGHVCLFVSGGKDSTLLALMMRELGIDFTPVVARLNPGYPANEWDFQRAREVMEYLGLNLKEIEINLADVIKNVERIVREMSFDRHFSLLHFGAVDRLCRELGQDIVLVNGQSCDAILSHGPSGNTRGDFAARILCHRPLSLWSLAAGLAVKLKHGSRYRLPRNRREYFMSRLDSFRYYSVLDKHAADSDRFYLGEIIDKLTTKFRQTGALNMYLSAYGYLQGADNQVVIRSARFRGIERVLMPYASPQIIYATVVHRDSSREIRQPKYPVLDALKKLGFNRKFGVSGGEAMVEPEMQQGISRIDGEFYRQAARLTTIDSSRVTG